jgi:type I restriction enzyme S subunit
MSKKGWREVTLISICTDISYGYTASANSNALGPKFLRITDIVPNQIDWEKVPYCNADNLVINKYELQNGDIVIARTGATTGYNKTIKNLQCNAIFASYLIRYRVDNKRADPYYVGYILSSKTWQEYVNAIAGGSAQPGANANQLGSFKFFLPPLPEQKSIASILSSLDDKIDLLHRQNKTLEAMAETLFRQWFVEEADEEWEEKPLSAIADFLNGLACQKYPPKNDIDKLPVLKIKELNSGITDQSDWAMSDIEKEYIVHLGDVIFSWSATLMVKIWDGSDCILNQHLFKVSSKDYPKWFYYEWCKYHLNEFVAISQSHATTMGHIKRGDLDKAMVLVPSKKELDKMTEIMQPLLEKSLDNARQIGILVGLRDALLPKLMSGEVMII